MLPFESFSPQRNFPDQEGFGPEPEFVKHPEALKRAKVIIEENQTKLEDFSTLYGEDVIERDTKYVDDLEKKFHANDFRDTDAKVAKEKAEIFEAIFSQEGDQAMWFGENSAIIMPSKYDDIANGVDSIVEIERQHGLAIAALSLDLTFKTDVGTKIDSIAEKVMRGQAAKIKYYESELGDIRGEISKVPHFAVGINARTLGELTNLFAEKKSSHFAKHPVQFQIIESIIIQSDTFATVAKHHGHDDLEKGYERIGKIFREIYETRKGEVKDTGQRDSSFYTLKRELSSLRQQFNY